MLPPLLAGLEAWLLPSLPLSPRGPGPSSLAALGMPVRRDGRAQGRRDEALLTSADLLCVGFLHSLWSARPEEPSRRQRDQDPLPHCQEDAGVPSQHPPGSPVPALLEGTAALPVQVGGSRPGCRGSLLGPPSAGGGTGSFCRSVVSVPDVWPARVGCVHRRVSPPPLSGSCQLAGGDRGDGHCPDRRGHAELHLGVLHGETSAQSLGPEQCPGSGELQCRAGGEAGGPSVPPPCAAALL